MKVAYLTNQYPKVSHTFVRREIRALEELGHVVERLSVRPCPDKLTDPEDQVEQACTYVFLDNAGKKLAGAMAAMAASNPQALARGSRLAAKLRHPSERGVVHHAAYLAEACLLIQLCKQRGVEHVHVHFGTNPATVAMLAREMGGPSFSFTVHGPEEFDKPQLIHLSKKIERAAFVVAISSFGKSQLYRWCKATDWDKVHVVRCGVDASYLSTPPPPQETNDTLVCVGRLCEQKGQLLLIEAAARVKQMGRNFRLVLVGDGEMRNEIEQRIRAHDLTDVVHITGWASGDEVRKHLASCRAMVLPSFAEGLPVVIMEALALERPVITTYIAGIPELVQNDRNGWLVPAGDVEALASAMQAALDTPSDRLKELGSAGRASVVERHSVESNALILDRLFRQTSHSRS